MYIEKTYQDYLGAANKINFIVECVRNYKASSWFKTACRADRYAHGDTKILNRSKMKMVAMTRVEDEGGEERYLKTGGLREVAMNRISSDLFGRLVDQRVQYLVNNGLNMDAEKKAEIFGRNADNVIETAAETAVKHGESYLIVDETGLRCIEAASANELSGMFFLMDETNGMPMIGVQFYQLSSTRPMTIVLYDKTGYIVYTMDNTAIKKADEQTYFVQRRADATGVTETGYGYDVIPFVILRGNKNGYSAFTRNIESKIDMYDIVMSDFADNLERMEGIYWAIKNFGGTADEAKAMLAELEALKAAVTQNDMMGEAEMDAHPQAIEAPYAARQYALELIRGAIHEDFMALDMRGLTGSSLTNVAIETATANLELACDKLETQIFEAIYGILSVIGKTDVYDEIDKFQRRRISNQRETIEMIYNTGLREDMTREKALEKTGLFEADELEEMLKAKEFEEMTGMRDNEEIMNDEAQTE